MTDQLEFYLRRERQERAAAKQASSLAAKRVHQELARLYALRLHGAEPGGVRNGA